MNLAGPAKIAVAEYLQNGNTVAPTNSNTGFTSGTSDYVTGITIGGTASAPTVTINYDDPPSTGLGTGSVILTGTNSGGVLDWDCSAASAATASALPSNCR
ncbi:pilin [Halomonas organivorans]